MVIHIIMPALKSLADENSAQHGKDERLQECYQYLDKVNEHGKCNGKRRKSDSCIFIQARQDKDQRDQTDDEDMTCQHIGKQPDH